MRRDNLPQRRLGLTERNKKHFLAQGMLAQLSVLAHNVIVWSRAQLALTCPRLARLGIVRTVRDVLTTTGWPQTHLEDQIFQITLNRADCMSAIGWAACR